MSYFDTAWYVNYGNGSSTGYYATAAWAATTVKAAGALIRPFTAPAVNNERIYVATTGGTTGGTEPVWTFTRGAVQPTDGSVVWQECTGQPGVNGDTANSVVWLTVKNKAVSIGQIIYDSVSGSLQIASVAGNAGNGAQPTFSATAGVVTNDGAVLRWTSLGLASGFTAFLAPHARFANALATNWGLAGNTFAISNNHAETQNTAMTLTSIGTIASPQAAYCINDSTVLSSATLASTATISTTVASNLNVFSAGAPYISLYGLNFSAGSGANTANLVLGNGGTSIFADTCSFGLGNSNAASVMSIGNGSVGSDNINLSNCTLTFGSTGQAVNSGLNVGFTMAGGSIAATGSVPVTLFNITSSRAPYIILRDVDLSAISGNIYGGTNLGGYVDVQNCKLNAAATPVSAIGGANAGSFRLHNSDSTSTNYRYLFQNGLGTVQSETSMVRSGGATDGTTPLSWLITTGANTKITQPFQCEDISRWNSLTGSPLTVTLYLESNTALDNSKMWIQVEEPGTSGFPLGVNVSTRMTLLGTPTNLTSDSSTWGGSALTHKYKIVATITPQNAGPVKCRIFVAVPSAAIVVDPLFTIT